MDTFAMPKAMRALSKEHRAVIGELFFRRRTVAEAASVLGISPSAVKAQSICALRALHDALKKQDH